MTQRQSAHGRPAVGRCRRERAHAIAASGERDRRLRAPRDTQSIVFLSSGGIEGVVFRSWRCRCLCCADISRLSLHRVSGSARLSLSRSASYERQRIIGERDQRSRRRRDEARSSFAAASCGQAAHCTSAAVLGSIRRTPGIFGRSDMGSRRDAVSRLWCAKRALTVRGRPKRAPAAGSARCARRPRP